MIFDDRLFGPTMFKGLFGLGKKNSKPHADGAAKVRRTIPLTGLDDRERSMLTGFQMLSGNVADPDSNSTDDILQFYREAQICGKTELAMGWMLECLPQRPDEDYHSERRQVMAECIASLMGPDDFVDNLNHALDQGAAEPNQRMIDRAKTALLLVGIMRERRCVDSLIAYNPLGKSEHELWFLTLSRVPDDRCAMALLGFIRRGRLFVLECKQAIEDALRHYGVQLSKPLLKQFADLEGISYRALQGDGSYSNPQAIDCAQIQRLALDAMRV